MVKLKYKNVKIYIYQPIRGVDYVSGTDVVRYISYRKHYTCSI